jgi:hypothetical protein
VRAGLDPRPGDQRRKVRQALGTAGLVLVLLALSVLAWMTIADVYSAGIGM